MSEVSGGSYARVGVTSSLAGWAGSETDPRLLKLFWRPKDYRRVRYFRHCRRIREATPRPPRYVRRQGLRVKQVTARLLPRDPTARMFKHFSGAKLDSLTKIIGLVRSRGETDADLRARALMMLKNGTFSNAAIS